MEWDNECTKTRGEKPIAEEVIANAYSVVTDVSTQALSDEESAALRKQRLKKALKIACVAVALSAVGAASTVFALYVRQMTWVQMQHVIGAVGGLIIIGGLLALSFARDSVVPIAVFGGIIMIVNITLSFVILRSVYGIIAYWIYGELALGFIVAAILSLDSNRKTAILFSGIEATLDLVGLLVFALISLIY